MNQRSAVIAIHRKYQIGSKAWTKAEYISVFWIISKSNDELWANDF